MFVFVYLMIYNNEVIIELYLLNFGVLMIPQESKDEPKKLNQVADASMKKTESSIQGYTFWEVLSFKLFTCCNKKSARYRQYRKHKEIIEERMDIVNFISNEGYASLLSKLLMKPYQLKMTSHLKTTQKSIHELTGKIPMNQAILMLEQKQTIQDDAAIEQRVNKTLLKTLHYHGLNTQVTKEDEPEEENLGRNKPSTTDNPSRSNTNIQFNIKKDQKVAALKYNKSGKTLTDDRPVKISKPTTAPFDFFGMNAKFYVEGRNRTLTWIGCFCSAVLIGTITTLFVFQI